MSRLRPRIGKQTQDNVKAKIQDKEVNLRQYQGKDPGQGSTLERMLKQRSKTRKQTWDNVKAKIQDKEVRLRTMSRPKSKVSKFLKKYWSNILWGWYIVGLKSDQMLSNISHIGRRCKLQSNVCVTSWKFDMILWLFSQPLQLLIMIV
jgi:uncharacterized protein YqeY